MATMNARTCAPLGARRTNAVHGAGRKVVTATSGRVAAFTSAEYKVRRASRSIELVPPTSSCPPTAANRSRFFSMIKHASLHRGNPRPIPVVTHPVIPD